MDLLAWLVAPLFLLVGFETWATGHFSETSYRIGPVVLLQRWDLPESVLQVAEVKSSNALFWHAPSGAWLFQPRARYAGFLDYKGTARWVDDKVQVEIRAPLGLTLLLVLSLIAGFSAEVRLTALPVVLVVALFVLLIRSVVNSTLKEYHAYLTSLTSASS